METMNQNTNHNDKATSAAAPANGNAGGNAAHGAANSTANSTANGATNGADDMLCLMGQSQKTCALGQWMRCMRKPALSMQYSLTKKHVPDMDDDPAGQTPVKGANSDTATLSGGFTIRYFDLAAGAMLMLVAGCMVKAMCCMRKMM